MCKYLHIVANELPLSGGTMKEKSQGFASTEELTPFPLSAVEPRVGGLRSTIRSFSQRENFEHPRPAVSLGMDSSMRGLTEREIPGCE
jgi:hypothetical protein